MMSRELSKEVKPDLYPDVVAAGNLSTALAQALANPGSPLQPVSLINFLVFAQTERGSRFCQMYISAHERLFIFDFWSKGVGYGKGSTSSLHDAAQAIHFWLIEQPDLLAPLQPSTGYPFTRDCPYAIPIANGRFRAYYPGSYGEVAAMGEMIGEGDVNEVILMLVDHLPPNCGPASTAQRTT